MMDQPGQGIERPAQRRRHSGADGVASAERTSPQWPRKALRVVAGVQATLLFVQAVLAGHLLAGNAIARSVHQELGTEGITWIALIAIVLAVLAWRPGRGPAWPIAAAAVAFGAVILQIGMGFEGRVSVHVPLGVAILVINLALALWLRPRVRTV